MTNTNTRVDSLKLYNSSTFLRVFFFHCCTRTFFQLFADGFFINKYLDFDFSHLNIYNTDNDNIHTPTYMYRKQVFPHPQYKINKWCSWSSLLVVFLRTVHIPGVHIRENRPRKYACFIHASILRRSSAFLILLRFKKHDRSEIRLRMMSYCAKE